MILLAGATGMLGGAIAGRLRDDGKAVRALVRPTTDSRSLEAKGVEIAPGDLKDRASLDRACQGVTVVITTANSAARGGDDNPETVEERGNRNLVDAARAAGVRHFIFTSALGSDLNSPVPFIRGKAIAEQYLKESGLTYTIVMPNLLMEVWFPNIVSGPVLADRPVTLVGDGRRRHSMISYEDVAAFATAAAGNEHAYNRVLVLGGPEPVSWLDVVAAHERALRRLIEVRFIAMGQPLPGYPDFVSGFMNALETYDSIIDMDSLAREFGVRQTSIDESISRQLAGVHAC
jgi:uncharacterized protein YbjT (DUF2867 family)